VWLLGSSDYSARLAAALGLPFAFAEFFGINGDIGPKVSQLYRDLFQPSRFLAQPRVMVALQVCCAPTMDEARHVAASRQLARANRFLRLGLTGGFLPPDEAATFPLTTEQRAYVDGLTQGVVDGDPPAVREGILQAAEAFGTTDIGVVTNTYRFEDRVRSYRLVADAMGVKAPNAAGAASGQ
jgi:alkanesulfonate monooxygenase SsuD/methylene tetrahydromethanopterin reductase-like flavin-dependent oxidoreductase (luciferase family)